MYHRMLLSRETHLGLCMTSKFTKMICMFEAILSCHIINMESLFLNSSFIPGFPSLSVFTT